MSDNESSDGMAELEALKKEYGAKDDYTKRTDVAEEKLPIEKIIFGDKKEFIKSLAKAVGEDFHSDNDGGTTKMRKRKPAWTDADDDEELQVGEVIRATKYTGPLNHLRKDKSYKEYLTSKFTRVVNQPKWASLDKKPKAKDDDADSSDEELLKTVGFIDKRSSVRALRPTTVQIKSLKDLNRASYAEGAITGIQFHPTSTAALVAGESGIISIYSVDGQKNEKLHSVRIKNYPIKCAKLMPCGKKAFFGSIRPYYYAYDLLTAQETKLTLPRELSSFRRFEVSPCGRYIAMVGLFGAVHLITANSNELIHSFKQEEVAAGLSFTNDSSRLICNGNSNYVSIFSLRQQRMEHKFIDDGCIKGKCLHLSPNQRLLATGSKEGVVNVYDFESVLNSHAPLPIKSFMNLTTEITHVRFNHSSEILGMCSGEVPNGIKLAHFPSATVYANFPSFQAKLGNVRTLEFSSTSGFMALGTKGKAPLFRLGHFKNY